MSHPKRRIGRQPERRSDVFIGCLEGRGATTGWTGRGPCGANPGSAGASFGGWRGPGFSSAVVALRGGLHRPHRSELALRLLALQWILERCGGCRFGLKLEPSRGGRPRKSTCATCSRRYKRKHPGRSQGVPLRSRTLIERGAGCNACSRCRTCHHRSATGRPC